MKKVILITGVSSGFGKESARLLAEAGHTVYGTVRRDCETDKSVNVLRMDLTEPASISGAVETVIKKEGRIDVLINNAAMHSAGPVESIPEEFIKLQIDTNFMGMVRMTRAVLPHMRKQGSGTIINFSSIGGLMGLPFHAFYSACKFAIEGFSEALRMEVRQFNIKVVLINPGDFNTNNTMSRRNFLSPTGPEDPYNKQFMTALSVMERNELAGSKPSKLAAKIGKIVGKKHPNQRYIIGAFHEKMAARLKYFLPGKLFRWILEKNYKMK
ncbi:MAG: SDR family oxidoreductase [Bacteroidales bacterium]|jgi:NAD(P)-dependent dehydrogenase (short-subunit alcohol dehydrogenase family)|nr:SDR family oxidoreductase [Bacteroidales bacterium]